MKPTLYVIHSLPGRTRIKIVNLTAKPVLLEVYSRRNPKIYSAHYSEASATLLIYHAQDLEAKEVLSYVKTYFSIGSAKSFLNSIEQKSLAIANSNSEFHGELKKNLLAVSVFLAERFLFPGVITNRLFSPVNIATIIAASGIIRNGVVNLLRNKQVNADTLTATAVVAAVLKGKPSSALTIVLLSTISEGLTEYTAKRTRNYVTNVLKLDVPFVWKVDESGKEIKVPVEMVKPGDVVAVFVGEKISVDGTVTKGIGAVDESSITGEYLPKEVEEGHFVYAGSVLKNGQIQIQVKNVGDDTAITRMIKLIEEAQTKQAPIQSQADKMSQALVPVSFLMAAIVYFMTKDWNRVMNMLFIDYACGLKLSTATAISASIGKAAKQGILIKGGQYLERLSAVNTVVLDKTGTVTAGDPVVKNIYGFQGHPADEVLKVAASCEEHSSHPVAVAILKKADQLKLEIPDHTEVETIIGRGVRAIVNGKQVLVGSDDFMIESDISMKDIQPQGALVKEEESLIYVAMNGHLIGAISYHDPVRNDMNRAINQLRRHGIDEIILLTGDKHKVAKETANELSLDAFYAEALPEDKANIIRGYRNKGNPVMMVGDGINDSPALAYADVGVTLGGKRTDIATETCDVIITSDDPQSLPKLISLSQNTMKVIEQNFYATIVINSLAMLLGATGTISPVVSAVIHNAATMGVVLNSSKVLISKN